jgi:hypothetical protein
LLLSPPTASNVYAELSGRISLDGAVPVICREARIAATVLLQAARTRSDIQTAGFQPSAMASATATTDALLSRHTLIALGIVESCSSVIQPRRVTR